ncbi:hypothetical protein F7725_013748 [Dissostichus mawsoni]|uniref:Uncharacterized protein n=1 Tax=Dissostichus mawsoni TaxID=36200 RepID=A0A7J5YUC0_DISMA|nr:hypothetical protein F7725_013748 [Dissostichus mawsoni]
MKMTTTFHIACGGNPAEPDRCEGTMERIQPRTDTAPPPAAVDLRVSSSLIPAPLTARLRHIPVS